MKTIEKLFTRINKNGPNGCWLWIGLLTKDVYPKVNWWGTTTKVHRLVYTKLKGPIPPEHELHHRVTCPKRCVNFEHMTPVLKKDHPDNICNIRRDNNKRKKQNGTASRRFETRVP